MKTSCILCAVSMLLTGCGRSDPAEGGFETPDLQARVITPEGAPAVGARVWLVSSRGDTAPAQVMDSTLTDSNGIARFRGQPANHSVYGIDARSEALMGMAPGSLVRTDSTRVVLSAAGTVSASGDALQPVPRLFVPGAHFVSRPGDDGQSAVLEIPRGHWDVAVATGSKTTVWKAVSVDSSAIVLPRDGLADSPDILLDSFRVDGMAMFLDTTIHQPWSWTRLDSVALQPPDFAEIAHCRPSLVADDSGATTFWTSNDTGSAVRSPALADSGAMAFSFRFWKDPNLDSGLSRIVQIVDSNGNGAWLELNTRTASPTSDSVLVKAVGAVESDSLRVNSLPGNQLGEVTWFITWNSVSITVRNSNGVVGRVNRSIGFHRLHFEISALPMMWMGSQQSPAKAQLSKVRYYRPK